MPPLYGNDLSVLFHVTPGWRGFRGIIHLKFHLYVNLSAVFRNAMTYTYTLTDLYSDQETKKCSQVKGLGQRSDELEIHGIQRFILISRNNRL